MSFKFHAIISEEFEAYFQSQHRRVSRSEQSRNKVTVRAA